MLKVYSTQLYFSFFHLSLLLSDPFVTYYNNYYYYGDALNVLQLSSWLRDVPMREFAFVTVLLL